MKGKSRDRASMKPWVSPRSDPVVGTQGGLKAERGRLSLAPLGPEGRDELPNGSNASVVGLVVRRYKRLTAYRMPNFEVVVGLIAELLYRVSRIGKGSVVYLNGRRVALLLGLDAPFHPVDLSVIYSLLARLGFEVVEVSRGKAVVMRTDHPLIKELRGVGSIDEAIEVVKKHLGE
jgi:hypothetical protein